MKRLVYCALAALLATTGVARAGSIGIGAFGGWSVPVLQEDQGQGSLYGLRVPVHLLPLLTVEPFYAETSLGDKTIDLAPGVSTTREGSSVDSYGLNAILTMSGPVTFYPFAGIGSSTFKRTGENETFTAYYLGLGLGLSPIPKFSIDLRAEMQVAADGDVSRKITNITLGASYALIPLP
jgi:hypothetical protein